jgi:cysteinyl-tRNA synthetase
LGNFITVADVLRLYRGEALKFAMLQTHYRHPFDFRWDRIQQADVALSRLINRANEAEAVIDEPDEAFVAALLDDLNTPLAMARLHDMDPARIKASLSLLGFEGRKRKEVLAPELQVLLDQRSEARRAKDWARSDALREQLLAHGIVVRDTGNSTVWERVIQHVS